MGGDDLDNLALLPGVVHIEGVEQLEVLFLGNIVGVNDFIDFVIVGCNVEGLKSGQ